MKIKHEWKKESIRDWAHSQWMVYYYKMNEVNSEENVFLFFFCGLLKHIGHWNGNQNTKWARFIASNWCHFKLYIHSYGFTMYTNWALEHSRKWQKLIKFYESRIQLITDYYYNIFFLFNYSNDPKYSANGNETVYWTKTNRWNTRLFVRIKCRMRANEPRHEGGRENEPKDFFKNTSHING